MASADPGASQNQILDPPGLLVDQNPQPAEEIRDSLHFVDDHESFERGQDALEISRAADHGGQSIMKLWR